MVRVTDRTAILPQGEPAHSPMVKLQELAVGLLALIVAQDEILVRLAREPSLLLKIFIIRFMTMRSGAVGPAGGFKLEHAKIHA